MVAVAAHRWVRNMLLACLVAALGATGSFMIVHMLVTELSPWHPFSVLDNLGLSFGVALGTGLILKAIGSRRVQP